MPATGGCGSDMKVTSILLAVLILAMALLLLVPGSDRAQAAPVRTLMSSGTSESLYDVWGSCASDDTTDPTVTINDIADFVRSLAQISGSAADTPPGQVDRVEVVVRNSTDNTYWDGSSWVVTETWLNASGTTFWNYSMPTLTDGKAYTVKAKSIDEAGNESTVASDSFTFDTTNPTVTISDIADFVSALAQISGSAADISPGQVDKVQVAVRNTTDNTYWDGSSWVATETWLDASGTSSWTYSMPALTNGKAYTVKAKSIDEAGNGSTVASDSFTCDTTNPTVTISDIADFVSALAQASGSASDTSPGQVDKVQVVVKNTTDNTYWDGSSWAVTETWLDASGTASWTYSLPALSDGKAYTVKAKSIDKAGNESTVASDSFTFDTTNPTVTVSDIADFVSALAQISGSAADTSPGQVDKVQVVVKNSTNNIYWNGSSWVATETWLDASGTSSWTYSMPALTNGKAYTVKAKSIDKAGNESTVASDSFTFDTTNPTVTISDIADFVSALAQISGSAADTSPGQVDKVQVVVKNTTDNTYWDGSSWAVTETWLDASGTTSWTYSLPALSDGKAYTVKAKSIDKAGNESTVASDSFTFDTTNPTVTISDIADFVSTLAQISGSAADTSPGQVNKVRVVVKNSTDNTYWNGSSWVATETWLDASGTTSWTYSMPALTDGKSYLVKAKSIDKAGNESTVASDSFTFDTTNPTVTINGIADFVSTLAQTGGSAADISPGQVDKVQVVVKNSTDNIYWNGSSWVVTETWLDASGTTSWTYSLPALSDGKAYLVKARSIDKAGNGSTVAADSFTFDTTNPTVTINGIADFVSALAQTSGSASDTSPGQVDKVQVAVRNTSDNTYWDGSSWVVTETWLDASGTTSWTYSMPALSDSKAYTVKARSIDRAGNESTVASDSFTFDTTNPTVTISDIADFVSPLAQTSGSAADTSPGQVDKVQVVVRNTSDNTYWDGSSWVATETWLDASGTASWTYSMPALSDGKAYTVKAKSIDKAGNGSTVAADSFTFDTTNPTVTISDIADFVSALAQTSGSAADISPGQVDKVQVAVRNTSDNVYWDGISWVVTETWLDASGTTAWTYSMPALSDGKAYVVKAKSIDKAGNESTVASDSFTFDTTNPTVTISDIADFVSALAQTGGSAADISPGQVDKVQVVVKNSTDNIYWNGSSWVVTETWLDASGTTSWACPMPTLINGKSYLVKAKSIDKAGNESTVASDSFTFDTTDPTVTISDIADFVSALAQTSGSAADTAPGQVKKVQVVVKNSTDNVYWYGSSWVATETWLDASGTTAWTYSMPALSDGKAYLVKPKSIDRAGNESTLASDSFT